MSSKSIDLGIKNTLEHLGIKLRPNASVGYWVLFLLPTSIILSLYRNQPIVSLQYKYATLISTGFIIASFTIIFNCYKSKKFPGNTITTAVAVYTSSLFYTCLHKSILFSTISGFFCVYLYVKGLPLLLRRCPKCFSLGEASVVIQGFILFIYMSIVNISNSFITTPQKLCHISNIILQVGLIGIAIICFIVYKYHFFRRTVPFYSLTLSVIFLWIFLPLHVILKRSPVLWILNLLTEKFSSIQMMAFWLICSSIAVLYLRRQIQQGKKANTIYRKIFHILAVLVMLPGLIDQCPILYLATGIILAVFIALEMLRLLNIPPLGSVLQDGFCVFADEKDSGGISLTPIYLLIGCSMPFWIHPEPCDVTDSAGFHLLPLISGLLSVGIGDTMASTFGKIIGRYRWPGSNKTIEGTIACIFSQLCFIYTLIHFGYVSNNNENIIRGVIAAIVSSLIEAKTDQVDNLILPLINYIILV